MPRVLLVEDNNADAAFIARRLEASERAVYTVDRANSMATALMVLKHRAVDVVLLDLSLGDSSGVETVVAMHRGAPDVPIVVLSAREDLETALNCVIEGAQSFLVKGDSLTTEVLEREIVFTAERNRKMNHSRRLLRETLSHHTQGAELLGAHVRALEAAIDEIVEYLRRNALTSYDAIEEILIKHGLRDVLRELRSLTVVSENPEQTAVNHAMVAIQEMNRLVTDINGRILVLGHSVMQRNRFVLALTFMVGLILGMILRGCT